MGVSLESKKFVRYAKSTPARVPCQFGKDGYATYVFCYGTTNRWTGLGISDSPRIPGAAARAVPVFQLAIQLLSVVCHDGYAMLLILRQQRMPNGPQSLEQCLIRSSFDNSCVRSSIGFELNFTDLSQPIFISRRVLTQEIHADWSHHGEPPKIDCSRLATSMLEKMCWQVSSLQEESVPRRMFSIQTQSRDPNGSVQWSSTAMMRMRLSNCWSE